MADDSDAIFVDVKARLDPASADEVASELQEKVGDATVGIGDKLRESFGHAGDFLKDAMSKEIPQGISDALEGVGTRAWNDFGRRAGEAIGGGVGGAIHDAAGGNLGDALEKMSAIPDALSAAFDKISGKLDGLGKIGDAAGNVLSGNGSGSDLDDILSGVKDLGLNLPGLGQLTAANNALNKMNEHPGQAEDWLSKNVPGIGTAENLLETGPADAGEYLRQNLFNGSPSPNRDAGSDKWSSEVAQAIDVTAESAIISAGSISLGGELPASLTGGSASSGSAGRVPSSIGSAGDSGSMAGLYGGDSAAQTTLGKFASGGDVSDVGGVIGDDSVPAVLAPGETVLTPGEASLWKMMQGAQHFAAGGESVSAGGASGGGGESVSDSSGGSGESVDSSSDSGGDSSGDASGSAAPGSAQGETPEVAGADNTADDANGTDVVDPTQEGIAGGTKNSKGIQDQSYGYGKGFQVTGQGLIGFAESAPGAIGSAIASGASYDGSGAASGAAAAAITSLWNTIGEPELNEAITEGVKVGADLASAPSQEFAVGGENFQNWSQKLIGGEIGSVTNLLNTAASTAAPLTPQDGSDQGLAGQAASGSNSSLGGQQSPAGTQGDPMHVSVVGGQSGQGQADAMSGVASASAGTA